MDVDEVALAFDQRELHKLTYCQVEVRASRTQNRLDVDDMSKSIAPGLAYAPVVDVTRENDAVRYLILLGAEPGVGITFEPWREEWSVGYMRGMGGGPLSTAATLELASDAAVEPLRALVEEIAERRRDRD